MRHALSILALLAATGLAGCTEDDTYPLTGEDCGPKDAVLELDAGDCTAPGGGGGTF